MTDLSHESNCDNLYNGLYPYYHQEKTSTTTTGEKDFTKAYVVGSKPFMEGWLSFTEGGEPYVPTSESPIQIASQGEYLDKVYAWSINNQRYIEKIYNEQFTIIQGVVEPTWITIDWSKFPVVAAKAAKNGYFKKATDQDWGEKKSVGDIIFEGNITSGGITQNLILYFSEVIPTSGDSENEEVSEVVNVELADPIIPIETNDTKNMKRKRILSVNFASEFDEEPTKEQLKEKALEYIQKNDLGIIKHTTTVSFVDLESTTEKDKYQKFDHIELGDTVEVIYEELGVDVHLRVISYEYDVLSDKYESVELGEKENGFASSSIQEGDGVSSLTNDADYTDTTRVKRLIADMITAEYLEATNARMSQATIRQLETERIVVKGIFEASQFVMDELVAKLLTVDNAKIANELAAGTVKIDGNITARTGNIGGFTIDSNSLSVGEVGKDGGVVVSTGTEGQYSIAGSEKINNWVFIAGSKFGVTKDGTLYALEAKISGSISALDGTIGGFIINSESIHSKDYVVDINNPNPTGTGIYLHKEGHIYVGEKFRVSPDGVVDAAQVNITGGEIGIGPLFDTTKKKKNLKDIEQRYAFRVKDDGSVLIGKSLHIEGTNQNPAKLSAGTSVDSQTGRYPFEVDGEGNLYATAANITGTINATTISCNNGKLSNFTLDEYSLHYGTLGGRYDETDIEHYPGSVYVSTGTPISATIGGVTKNNWVFTCCDTFGVNKDGSMYATKGVIGPLKIESRSETDNTVVFRVKDQSNRLIFEIDPTKYVPDYPVWDKPSYNMYAKAMKSDAFMGPGYSDTQDNGSGWFINSNGFTSYYSYRHWGIYEVHENNIPATHLKCLPIVLNDTDPEIYDRQKSSDGYGFDFSNNRCYKIVSFVLHPSLFDSNNWYGIDVSKYFQLRVISVQAIAESKTDVDESCPDTYSNIFVKNNFDKPNEQGLPEKKVYIGHDKRNAVDRYYVTIIGI